MHVVDRDMDIRSVTSYINSERPFPVFQALSVFSPQKRWKISSRVHEVVTLICVLP